MSNYNLSDNVEDSFNFDFTDKETGKKLKYTMRLPITEEVEQVQEISTQLQTAQDEKREDDVKNLSKKLETFLYGFISPVEHETPIEETLSKQNIRVMRNFNSMIKTELSIQ